MRPRRRWIQSLFALAVCSRPALGDSVGDDDCDEYGDCEDLAADAASTAGLYHGGGGAERGAGNGDAAASLPPVADLLQHYHNQVSVSNGDGTLNPIYGNEKRDLLMQIFHAVLLKSPQAAPWSSKSKKKSTKKQSLSQKSVSGFASDYGDSKLFATMYPEQHTGDSDPVLQLPNFCDNSGADFWTSAILHTLVRQNKIKKTLEVGLACGFSATSLAQTHRDSVAAARRGKKENARKKEDRLYVHYAIDPSQHAASAADGIAPQRMHWDGTAEKAIAALDLQNHFQLIPEPSHSGLPQLLRQYGPGSFGLIFIDGMHLFDFVMLEAFYADLLLPVGGFLVFDDTQMPSIQQAILFYIRNRNYAVVSTNDVITRATILKKLAVDEREWHHHRSF